MKKNKPLREGISTGACAAAAAKAAALLLWQGERPPVVEVQNLQGEMIKAKIAAAGFGEPGAGESAKTDNDKTETGSCYGQAWARVVKDAGDDPDVTNGLTIQATVRVVENADDDAHESLMPRIVIDGGQGVGRVTKPGLAISPGEAAINPVPRAMIEKAISVVWEDKIRKNSILPENGGVITGRGRMPSDSCCIKVLIEVPGGEETARKTLNPKLGIVGGISILGTTGKVKPMSEEAWKNSLPPQVKVAKAAGHRIICLTPGRMGEKWATEKYGIPADAVVQMSNFVGFMLTTCVEQGVEKVVLFGHHGKLTKVAAGNWHTHSKVADGRLETIAAMAASCGADAAMVREILSANVAEAVLDMFHEELRQKVYNMIAERAARKAENYVYNEMEVGCVLLSLKGEILGLDRKAVEIGREAGWNLAKFIL